MHSGNMSNLYRYLFKGFHCKAQLFVQATFHFYKELFCSMCHELRGDIYKGVSKSSRIVLVKRILLTLDTKFFHQLQSTPLLHECSGPSISAMLGSIPGSPFWELCQVPAAIPLESLEWCRIFDPSSEASACGKKSQGARSGEYRGWGITVMLFLAKNCETLKDL